MEIVKRREALEQGEVIEIDEDDEDEEMFGDDDIDELLAGRGSANAMREKFSQRDRERDGRKASKTIGVLERKGNATVVGGEVAIGKEARGAVKVCIFSPFLS